MLSITRRMRGLGLRLNGHRIRLATALPAIGYRPRIELIAKVQNFFRRIAGIRNPWNISDGDWVADYPSPAQFLSFVTCSSYHPEDPARTTNSGGYCDARLDRLVARADTLQLTDPAAAQAVWARADRRAVDQAPWVPLVSNSSVEFLSRRVGHFTLDPTSQAANRPALGAMNGPSRRPRHHALDPPHEGL
jgi:peptide/nickel transport system substrate-binding protein